MQCGKKSKTVPTTIITWFSGTEQRQTEKYHLVIFACKLLHTSVWEQGTLHPRQKMSGPEKLTCFITMSVSYAFLSLQYTLQIFTPKRLLEKKVYVASLHAIFGAYAQREFL